LGLVFDNLLEGSDFESLARFVKVYDDSASVWVTEEASGPFLSGELESIFDKGSDELAEG
jgi:hypothetical protein